MRLAAAASLVRHRARTALAVLGVAIAAALLLDMVMLSTGLRESFRRLLSGRGFQLRLAPRGTLPFDTEATIPGAGAIAATLRANPAVEAVSPVLGASVRSPRSRSASTRRCKGITSCSPDATRSDPTTSSRATASSARWALRRETR